MRNEELRERIGGCAVRGSRFLDGSAPPATQGFRRRADLYRKPVHYLRGLLTDSDGRNGTWRSPRAVCVPAVETCTEQVPWASPVIQARIERGQSAVGRGIVSRETFFIQGGCPPSFRFSLSF